MEKKNVKYVCEGTCKAQITEEKYEAGLHVCQTKDCTHFGQPFTKVEVSKEEGSDKSN